MSTSPASPAVVFLPCQSLDEAAFLLDQQTAYRQRAAQTEGDPLNADLVHRVARALREPKLTPIYLDYFRLLLEQTDFMKAQEIAQRLGLTVGQVGAMASKLSQRMKSILTAAEKAELRTPVYVMIDVGYDDANASYHKLQPVGRMAVQRLLGGRGG
jgi:hypothetical protein